MPYCCLVCDRPLRGHSLCFRCQLPPAMLTGLRCFQCFSSVIELDPAGRCTLCRMLPPPFGVTRHIWEYTGNAALIIKAMKYRPSRKLCVMATELLLSSWDELFLSSDWDLIVPIPPSLQSLKLRGFNQAAIIARTISKHRGIPVSLRALTHRGYKAPQASLKPERRLSNVKRAIRARASLVHEKRILLVDDVVTTGATVSVAIKALLNAGAAQVDIVSLARSQNWNSYRNKIQKIFT